MLNRRRLSRWCCAVSGGALVAVLCGAALAGPVDAQAAAKQPAPAGSPAPARQLGATPPMGWNDWYTFGCNLTEQLVEQTADTIVSSGMKAAGYDYVNLDDCWLSHERDAQGNLQADPTKFPHGIKAVADYVHARGLKLGIYEDVGTATCAGYPGSFGHVQQDANTFASWGIDFAKIDWCNVPFDQFPNLTQKQVAIKLYTQYSKALKATGRQIFFSVCEWDPTLEPWTWAPAIANMWRTNGDYGDTWAQILANLDQEAPLASAAGPGHWNDPDILQVGLGGMSTGEDRAHFSAWSMLAAPLLAGNDLRSMSAATKAILTNREVIAIDQDRLGAEATRLSHTNDADVWIRALANGDRAVMLLNRSDSARSISTTAHAAGLPRSSAYAVRDLWAHKTFESGGTIASSVPADSAVLYRVSAIHGGNAHPPLTDVAASVKAPAAFPGSTYHIVKPGQTVTATAVFRNDGTVPVRRLSMHLYGPSGWKVDHPSITAAVVPPGRSVSGSWPITVPAGTKAGSYEVNAFARYRWSGARPAATSGQGGVLVEVPPTGSPYLSDLTWLAATNGYGPVLLDENYYGGPIAIHGVTYAKGLWTNADASIDYYLGDSCTRFTADLGLDDSDRGTGTVVYQVFTDGTKVYDSGVVTNSTPTIHVDQNVSGANILQVVVTDAGDGVTYDNADFAAPQLTCAG